MEFKIIFTIHPRNLPGNRYISLSVADNKYKKSTDFSTKKVLIFVQKTDISMMVRVFANGSGDLGSVPGRVIPKTQKNGT